MSQIIFLFTKEYPRLPIDCDGAVDVAVVDEVLPPRSIRRHIRIVFRSPRAGHGIRVLYPAMWWLLWRSLPPALHADVRHEEDQVGHLARHPHYLPNVSVQNYLSGTRNFFLTLFRAADVFNYLICWVIVKDLSFCYDLGYKIKIKVCFI